MCSPVYLKPLYVITLILALVFTAIALFTPAWRKLDDENSLGLVSHRCDYPSCTLYSENRANWDKAALGLMTAALVVEVVLLIWAAFSWRPFFVPGYFVALAVLSVLALAFVLGALGLYGANSKEQFWSLQVSTIAPQAADSYRLATENQLGYSFWLAVTAAVFMTLATAIATANALLSLAVIV